jgi:hypothetical protein
MITLAVAVFARPTRPLEGANVAKAVYVATISTLYPGVITVITLSPLADTKSGIVNFINFAANVPNVRDRGGCATERESALRLGGRKG